MNGVADRPRKRSDKRKGAKDKPVRHGHPYMLWLPDDMASALREMAEANARTIKAELMLALRERLTSQGYWPPPDSHPDPV